MNQTTFITLLVLAILVFGYFCTCSCKCGTEDFEPNMITDTDYHLEPGEIADSGNFRNDLYSYIDGQ